MIKCNLFNDYNQVYILVLKDNKYRVLDKDDFNVKIDDNNEVILFSNNQSIKISLFEFYKSYIFYNKKELNDFSFDYRKLLSTMKRSFKSVSLYISFYEICHERGINDETAGYIIEQNSFKRFYSGWYPFIRKYHTMLYIYSSFDISLANMYISVKAIYNDTINDFYEMNDYFNHIPSFIMQIELLSKESSA